MCDVSCVDTKSREYTLASRWRMKERESTILSTPVSEFFPNMGGRQVKKISYDGVAFGTGGQTRKRMPSTQPYQRGTPNDDRSQREVRVVVYQVKNSGEHLDL